ncbi:MAG: Flp pilus assembly complex ATPase component TadA [Armatimonadetes bacterium]|nr:Flp pilus assembly complex ATPase component TadA [Armatimonadota bacterium]
MITSTPAGETIVPGRAARLVLGQSGLAFISARGQPAVPERPTAHYDELAGVELAGAHVRLRFTTPGPEWDFVAVSPEAAQWAGEFLLSLQAAAQARRAAMKKPELDAVATQLETLLSPQAPQVAAAAEYLLAAAAGLRATDVHVVPAGGKTVVRLRIDGLLHQVAALEPEVAADLQRRLKAMANLPSYITDSPQYGRLTLALGEGVVDARLTATPAVGGEALALRLLGASDGELTLDRLGLEAEQQEFLEALPRSTGLVVFTGPAGSGKTTTMYALAERALETRQDLAVVTVEEPPERALAGATQLDVRALGGRWDEALQAALRLDPSVLVLGEIRDGQTAALAGHAALSGHLLLTTMHAGTVAEVPPRLLQLGVPPSVVASGLRVVVAQRLLRRVCPSCSVPDTPSPDLLAAVGAAAQPGAPFARGRGCAECAGTGLRGRVAVFELMPVTEALRRLILASAPAEEYARLGGALPGPTLRVAALAKAARGEVPLAEVLDVLGPVGGDSNA